MVVIINGSFGVGKTTVARLLRDALPGSVVYDPEWAGLMLSRMPGWIKLEGSGTDDFQDIRLWRKLTVAGIRVFGAVARNEVIVPMTFSRRDYLDEVINGVRRHDPEARVFCLRAALPTIKRRLAGRGTSVEGPGSEWMARRIIECVEAHAEPHFGEAVETEGRNAREVADHIIRRLRETRASTA